jgi:alpha-ketoglutarate-dependent taurine dioxygenase
MWSSLPGRFGGATVRSRWTRASAWPFTPWSVRSLSSLSVKRQEESPALVLDLFSPVLTRGKVAIRDRPHLPRSDAAGLPEFAAEANPLFPAVYRPQCADPEDWDLDDWANAVAASLKGNLHRHGAMLFRGIPGLDDVKDFTMLNRYMKVQLMPDSSYQKAMQARSMSSTSVNKVVRTASDEPPAYTIEPHNEYHTVDFPTKLLLFCQDPPSKGGEWLLSDGRAIFQQIHPDVVARFEEKQACYRVFYESYAENNRYTNWQTNIAPTKPEVEEYLTSKGYQWEWGEDDSLTYWKNFPAVVPHPVTGERCWFNQIHAHHKTFYTNHPFFADAPVPDGRWPVHSTYGDGTEIEQEVLEHLREVIWANTVVIAPQPGDVLVVDNFLMKHGRMGFPEGVDRKVFVSCAYN